MDPVRAQRLLWFLSVLGFGMAILGAVGELLGWWNDIGELLMGLGTLLGVVMAAASVTTGASHEQVQTVQRGVETTHGKLDSMDGKLDSMDGKLDSMDCTLDSMDGRLEHLDRLDVIEAELNAQTGALDRQIQVLEQIRDAE